MKKEDLKIVQGQIEWYPDNYEYMRTSEINWDEYNKRKVCEGILEELLKNDFIDFETITLPNGNTQIKGKVTVYKKSED